MDAEESNPLKAQVIKYEKQLREDAKTMHRIMQELMERSSSLLVDREDLDMDPAECAQVVAEIDELDKKRREIDMRTDRITNKILALLISVSKDKRKDDAEFLELVDQFAKISEQQREENQVMDHFMQEMSAHCCSHLALVFEFLLEE
ncbi:uncharacterized protein LOC117648010 isoform X2 [Thrips palmi]|nr:uncharacterized protein LOC117648010 isoform X2 [Thrips palmi]